MKARIHLLAALPFLVTVAGGYAVAAPITVLGLPLGGKLNIPIRQCADSEIGSEVRTLCWVGKPTRVTGGSLHGGLSVPGADNRPKWAEHATFDAWLAKDGRLTSFNVRTHSGKDHPEIVSSIASRFGKPARVSNASAEWHGPDAHILLLCSPGWCNTEFKSSAAQESLQRELAARKAKDAARSVAP